MKRNTKSIHEAAPRKAIEVNSFRMRADTREILDRVVFGMKQAGVRTTMIALVHKYVVKGSAADLAKYPVTK